MDHYDELRVDLAVVEDRLIVAASSRQGETEAITNSMTHLHALDGLTQQVAAKQATSQQLYSYGQKISAVLLPGSVRSLFESTLSALPDDVGLRLRLVLRSTDLAAIPWEYAYVPSLSEGTRLGPPLVLDERVSLVRHVAQPSECPALHLNPNEPLRVTIAAATSVAGFVALQPGESGRLAEFLRAAGHKVLLLGDPVTASELRLGLRDTSDVFQFNGHAESGCLVLASPGDASSDRLDADDLADALTSSGAQLVVLSACGSGQSDPGRFAGIASTLVERGIPAVVAMQHALEDSHAVEFSTAFYAALSAGHLIDDCVAAGRRAMRNLGLMSEWGVPVLYMRATEIDAFSGAPGNGHYALDVERPRGPDPGSTCPIGREREIDLLVGALDELENGSVGSRIVLLSGDSGVGKSALARHVVSQSLARGYRCANVVCEPFHEGMSFFPIRELIRQLSRSNDQIAEVVREYGQSSSQVAMAEVADTPNADPVHRREAMIATFSNVVMGRYRRSGQPPTVLTIDDMERVDAGTIDALLCLLARIREGPVLIVGAFRSDIVGPAERSHALAPLLEAVRRAPDLFDEVEVAPLRKRFMTDLVESILGGQAALPPGLIDRLWNETEGNPLFAREVLRALQAGSGPTLRAVDGKWRLDGRLEDLVTPRSIEEAIHGRLNLLDKSALSALERASVIGRRFAFEIISSVSEADEPDLLDQLETCIDLSLIQELTSHDETFEFTHGKIREVLYQQMPRIRRRRMHSRVADALQAARSAISEDWNALVGEHLFHAGRFEEAFPLLLSSARSLMGLHAGAEAATVYERAITAAQACDLSPQETDDLVLERIAALKLGSEYDLATSLCLQLADSDNPRTAGWALNHLGDMYWMNGRYDDARVAYGRCEERLLLFDDALLRAELAADLSEFHDREAERLAGVDNVLSAERRREADEHLRDQLDLAEMVGDHALLSRAYRNHAKALRKAGEIAGSLEYYERAISLTDSRVTTHKVLISYAKTLRFAGRSSEAEEIIRRVEDWSQQSGARRSLAIAYYYRAMLALETVGATDDCLMLLRKALSIHDEIGYDRGKREVSTLVGEWHLARKNYAEAITVFRRVLGRDAPADPDRVLEAICDQIRATDEHERAARVEVFKAG